MSELLVAADALRERRRQEQAAQAEARRVAELKTLATREDDAWREVSALIQQSQAKPYDQAVQLLKRLRDLAAYQGQEAAFEGRLREICDLYSRRSALMSRLRQANLKR